MERTASGKTNVIPYSQYRKSRLDSIRNDLGLQGKSATCPYDSCVLVSVAVGYGSGTSLPFFCSLGYRLQSASHAWTLFAPTWASRVRPTHTPLSTLFEFFKMPAR